MGVPHLSCKSLCDELYSLIRSDQKLITPLPASTFATLPFFPILHLLPPFRPSSLALSPPSKDGFTLQTPQRRLDYTRQLRLRFAS